MGFRLIFWGILFLFSIRIQGVDILPDIIGYILIFNGLKALLDKNEHFATARKFCVPLIIISIFEIYEKPNHMSGIHVYPFSLLIGIASLILVLFLFYHICQGMKEWALERHNPSFAERIHSRWTHFWAMKVLSYGAILLMFIPPLAILAVILIFLYSIGVLAMMMQLMDDAGRALPLTEDQE